MMSGLTDAEAIEAWRLIEVLSDGEGDSVTVLCPNPDFNGQPAYAIECNGMWTSYIDRRFADDSQIECFRKAVKAMREGFDPHPQNPGGACLNQGDEG